MCEGLDETLAREVDWLEYHLAGRRGPSHARAMCLKNSVSRVVKSTCHARHSHGNGIDECAGSNDDFRPSQNAQGYIIWSGGG